MAHTGKQLYLTFHGRILEHLGIQAYQSPVSALAELVANGWDADAEIVRITLPDALGPDATITVADDGAGMTFDQCQERYLNVGWNRRRGDPNQRTEKKLRPVLGRKGIGKFAGFGIAKDITVTTVSEQTGERTVFQLSLSRLLSDEYVDTTRQPIDVLQYEPPDAVRRHEHGTIVTLSSLTIPRPLPPAKFARSMARRFLLHQTQADFRVLVNGEPLAQSLDLEDAEYLFPRDYDSATRPARLRDTDEQGWGTEEIDGGHTIRWRFVFHRRPIDDEELRGVSVFAKGKLAQAPFFFNLAGGLGGQHGMEYLSGQVQADFIDGGENDLISTERQRINWQHVLTSPLLDWGQNRLKELLRLWRDRRAEERIKKIEQRVAAFSSRLDKLGPREARTVTGALRRIAQVPAIDDEQFQELGQAILLAWEQGRLRELISDISNLESLSEAELLSILVEAKVLTALNVAEAVKTKVSAIDGLEKRLRQRDLERAVRDYVAENPWLIAPQWETFRVERSVARLAADAAQRAQLVGQDWDGRVDLALASGHTLLILEFMRPGLRLDWDHLQRFERYVLIMRSAIAANTAGPFKVVTGYIVADGLTDAAGNRDKVRDMAQREMYALDWYTLLSNAKRTWQDFLEVLAAREPEDERLKALLAANERAAEEPDGGAASAPGP